MSRTPDGARSAARPVLAAVVATAAVALAPVSVGSTGALFGSRGTATTTITTAEACASGPDAPYATHVASLADAPRLWWRFGEAAGATTVADAAGGDDEGAVVGSSPADALTFGVPGLPECDDTGALQQAASPAGTGLVAVPTPHAAPATYTVALWVRAGAGASGGLAAFGDSATDASTSAPIALALDAQSRAALVVASSTGPVVVRSSVMDALADGRPHLLVATSDAAGGEADLVLYLDGVPVDSATGVVLPTPGPGHWQTGGGDGPSARAVLDELMVWEGVALTAGQVADLHAADHW